MNEFSLWVASRFQRQASSANFTPRVGRRATENERRGREGSRTQQLVTRHSRKLAKLSFTCYKQYVTQTKFLITLPQATFQPIELAELFLESYVHATRT